MKGKNEYEVIEIELTEEESKQIFDLPLESHAHIKIGKRKELLITKIKERKEK